MDYFNDPDFIDVGDLPSGFVPYADHSRMYLKPFTVKALELINRGAQTKNLNHIIRAVAMGSSMDVRLLTDGDFEFVCAWLRTHSYPKAPMLVNWTCKKHNLVYIHNDRPYKGPALTAREIAKKGLKYKLCDASNPEIVHKYQTRVLALEDDFAGLPDGFEFPKMRTLLEYMELIEKDPGLAHMASVARWLALDVDENGEATDTLQTRLKQLMSEPDLVKYEKILELKKEFAHGIYEVKDLKCRMCGNEVTHRSEVNLLTFFADNTAQDLMDMQYSLLNKFGMQPDDNMPSKKLLYHYSCYVKDEREAREAELRRQAAKR